jgi:HlyD family secretion protein
MRALLAVLTFIVLFPAAISNPERPKLPTVSALTVTISEVGDTLFVERPVDAREDAQASVFVVDDDGTLLRRVPIVYGRASRSLIQIVSGVSPGDRIVVSDMRAWDVFERVQLR